jgi:hypothetical protein
LKAAGAVAKIVSSLKSNHHRQIYLAQISETHCRNWMYWKRSKDLEGFGNYYILWPQPQNYYFPLGGLGSLKNKGDNGRRQKNLRKKIFLSFFSIFDRDFLTDKRT